MGYRKIDPRTKAAAIKAMRKAVEENGLSASAAARELSAKYQVGATTLQKYFAEAHPAPAPEPAAHEPESAPRAAEPVVEQAHRSQLAPVEAALVANINGSLRQNNTAGLLSAEFTNTLETLSGEFVARLQEAALDDLINKMQELRDSLRR